MRNKLFNRFWILATLACVSASVGAVEPSNDNPSPNQLSESRYLNDLADLKFETSVYPQTISVGDVAYLHVKETNVSETPFWIFHEEHLAARNFAVLSSSASPKRPIFTLDGRSSLFPPTLNLRPGKTYEYSRRLCVCPTPYWEERPKSSELAQFWKDALQQVAEKGSVDCEVTLYAAPPLLMFQNHNIELPLLNKLDDSVYAPIGSASFTITSRSEKETQALESLWRGSQGAATVAFKISGQTFDLTHYFTGLMNPRNCDLPQTAEGWRDLEERFSPSTLRDEITLNRLIVEYYVAEQGKKSDEAFAKIFEFINSRPQEQRCAFLTTLQRTGDYPHDKVTLCQTKNIKLASEAERVKGFERAL